MVPVVRPRRFAPMLALAVAASLLAPAATAQTDPAEDAVEDAATHAEWAAEDPEGFAENHTTDPHRDPVEAGADYACRTADAAGAGGETGAVCPGDDAPEDEAPEEEQDEDAANEDDGPAGAGEAVGNVVDFAGDVVEEPDEAPWHALDLVRDTASWLRGVVEDATGLAAPAVRVPVEAGLSSADGARDGAAAAGETGQRAVDGVAAAFRLAGDRLEAAPGEAGSRLASAAAAGASTAEAVGDGVAAAGEQASGVVGQLQEMIAGAEDEAPESPAPDPDVEVRDEPAGGPSEVLPGLG